MPVIQVQNLKKYYKVHQKEPGLSGSIRSLFSRKYYDAKAVDGVSFDIGEGELVGFIGPNGAGKTTTLKVLSGLLYPTSGTVSVLGFTPWDRKPEFQKQFSLVMGQKNQLWWDLPAMESFILNKEIYEVPDAQFKQTLDELVELLEVKDFLKVQVRKLSLGQRMKMELIAALIHSPRILFLDEPTIGLDVVMQKKMRDFIKEYNQRFNSTIILTSHYMDDVKELCERVIIIDKGRLLFDGALAEIIKKFANHKLLTAVFSEEVNREDLEKIGQVKEFDYPRAVISVKRTVASQAAAQLLQNFPVADLNIEEPQIEDIIREVFTGKDLA
ncbi:MAG: ABC transporter related protein [Candidatus Amesbacteria bacterium GW2011_GWA1_47_16]|uniref:ABC transporter n=5 Tax=Candidatus Amesiibacteriota TaxID=1752730 RepID=A0A1F4ZS00_9BACT|nr:MAG: ABC transporter related protein [Candidatus Amesbacteria bacterium GW2011_GWA1_47_16]KKU65188.1 MAG: ABC transporter related protein [Candidatus Amesbacteria bacterium GW2011_GWC1_47_15]KKU98451.1 MAG: ABC transporter related protein [Candidatus Amesbacteria bacterium GW2011_GWB1_48_13]OGD00331.1 MAG: ABC transporter [Candidatus Amesbacteria bacterium RIFCSPLOWO2_01_FULL_47_33]OGD00903.1 MAG: ABC transporter [Candidatus Amesbacteria bacterium RIFCSPHIGHO2_01_FULL_47_34]OGD09020.1 MAG: 